jgi:hypothetical protein
MEGTQWLGHSLRCRADLLGAAPVPHAASDGARTKPRPIGRYVSRVPRVPRVPHAMGLSLRAIDPPPLKEWTGAAPASRRRNSSRKRSRAGENCTRSGLTELLH